MVTRDVYLQPAAPDPVLDAKTVLSIVRRFAPGASEVTAVDETGGEARAYMVDSGLVLKTQRPHRLRPRTSLEKEALFLRHIAGSGIPVPEVLGHGREGPIEYLCMTRMPGAAARRLDLDGDSRRQVLLSLGGTLRRLHSLPQEALASSPLMPGDRDPPAFRQRIQSMLTAALEALAAGPGAWTIDVPPERLAGALLESLPSDPPLVALHSNPGPEHTFVDPDSLEFRGLIDFGDAYISHPALDLRSWPRPADRSALLDGYAAGGEAEAIVPSVRAVWAVADIAAVATRPERRAAATENLRDFLTTLDL